MNYDEILTRLSKGETAEDIAKEMSDALNKAVETKKIQEQKDKEGADLANAVADSINKYAEYLGYEGAKLDASAVAKVMESFFKFYKDPSNFQIDFPGFHFETRTSEPKKNKIVKTSTPTKYLKTVDEILSDWFKNI